MTPDNLRDVLAEAAHEHIDGDFLLGGGGWLPHGWADDIPLHGARISDVVRWAINALAATVARLIADARTEERSLHEVSVYEAGREDGRAEQAAADRARVEAVLRLISPDHITPIGARQVRAALDSEGGERA
jgi:hypothetical protein